ncbi:hypothetical protein ASG63_08935 [Methylobacterium sp. Leaf94]|uniref:hypothetical protein n=1 Tax=Methylobacterium sp. Leaf94 TaxID=1736250 RepID=UPI0006F34BF3|nr:hypothetical protein [Methylobacterium sp. Leaf94]KQU17621.1 hypothetical protein ASG63_08935 [Methylobacterium sp. Leaf94]
MTAATRDQDFRRELVQRLGTLIHGGRWIAPLAADMSRVTGRAIGGPQISHWIAGTRPYPEWVESALLQITQDRIVAILDEGKRLSTEAHFLKARLTSRLVASSEPDPAPEPEPDDAPVPSMGM